MAILFSKRRWLRWAILGIVTIILLPFLGYRLPRGSPVVLEGEVRYQLLELGQGDYLRNHFERLCGNRRLFLVNADLPWLYVNEADWKRCWGEPGGDKSVRRQGEHSASVNVLDQHIAKEFTTRVTIRASPLLFGGYGPGNVVAIKMVQKPPVGGK
jgi:hypothetical protein